MAVIGQSHLLWRSRVPDHISHSNTIIRLVPIEAVQCQSYVAYIKTHARIQKIFSGGRGEGPNSQKGSDGKFQHGKN